MQQQLAGIIKSLESGQSRLRAITDKVSDKDWRKRPSPDRWSAADCVEHLNLTTRAYLPLLRDATDRARAIGGMPRKRYHRDPVGWFMAMMMGPLHHLGRLEVFPVKTRPPFVPKGSHSRDQLLSDFAQLESDIVTLVRSSDGLPLDRVKIVSPFGGRMKYNAYSALEIIARHQQRHIQQAERAAS